jgi:hypothetical protein
MALRLPLFIALAVLATTLPQLQPAALAAGLDAQGKATLKEATALYKQGQYEEAAKLITRLAVDHPEMASLQRNLGACYYYLRRPEPALSNLRGYLAQKKNDITAEDKAEVERWIDEMEKLRAQNAVAPVAPTVESPRKPQVEGGLALPPSEALAAPPPVPLPQPAVAPPLPAPLSPPQPPVAPPMPAPISPSPPQPLVAPQAPALSLPPEQPATASTVAPSQPEQALSPQPAPAAALPQAPRQPAESVVTEAGGSSKGSGLRIAGIACGVLGLASIGTAIYYYYARATSLSDQVSTANPASPSDYQAGKDAETRQWVFYGVGGAAIATGAVLYLLGHSQSAAPAQVSLAPVLGPGSAGLSARGRF